MKPLLIRQAVSRALGTLLILGTLPAVAATITVTGDHDGTLAALAQNNTCDLREAIQAANTDQPVGQCNAGSGTDTIAFNIPGNWLHVIGIDTLGVGALPAITTPVNIDGYSQPGSSVNTSTNAFNGQPRVALLARGNANVNWVSGLEYTGNGSGYVRGLIIGEFSFGIQVSSAGNVGIFGNIIGNNGTGKAYPNLIGVASYNSQDITIGSAALADRNLISANASNEVVVSGGPNVKISNNLIGTLADGNTKLAGPNGLVAVDIGNCKGISVLDNVIGGNNWGMSIGGEAHDIVVQKNKIGVGVKGGNIAGANGGIYIADMPGGGSPTSTLIGGASGVVLYSHGGNVIANWGGNGVSVDHLDANNANPSGIRILNNSIYQNVGLGISLADKTNNVNLGVDVNDSLDADKGPNGFQNYPIASVATTDGVNSTASFSLSSTPNTTFRIDFYINTTCHASGNGEGQTWLGARFVTTSQTGNVGTTASIPFAVPVGQFLTMTATDNATGNTSEFSPCQVVKKN